MLKSLHPLLSSMTARSIWAASLWLMLLLAMVILFLATPTLNFDDLSFGENMPNIVAHHGVIRTFIVELLNKVVGQAQIRTYGLARAIEVLTMALTGKAPLPTYIFMVVVHMVGTAIIYKFLREISDDAYVACLGAITWFAAPSILPLLKVEHHFLYLVVPFYPPLLWVLLTVQRGRISYLLSISLLTMTWWLGEAAIIPMGAAVILLTYMRRDPRIFVQGCVAFGLLTCFIVYQILFVSIPDLPQRITPHASSWSDARALLPQVWQNVRATLGMPYFDTEMASRIGGIKVFGSPVTLIAAVIAAAAAILAKPPTSVVTSLPRVENRQAAIVFISIAILSLTVFGLFAVFKIGALAVRYTSAFFAFVPLGIIATLAACASPSLARAAAAACAVFAVATSIGLLYRAEVLVNQPNRELLTMTAFCKDCILR